MCAFVAGLAETLGSLGAGLGSQRRRTWSERLQHYALVDKAQVEVEFFHPGPLKAILKHEIQENAM